MEIPITARQHCLIASIEASVSDQELLTLRNQLVKQVSEQHSIGVILDVTDLDVLDSFSVRILRDMANAVRLCGANTVIVGIQPDVALTMVQQGLKLDGIHTAMDLDDGLAYFEHLNRAT